MGDVKTDSTKTSAPRDTLKPKNAISVTRKIVISSDTQVVANSPRSPTSPRSGTLIPVMKESDIDSLDVEGMKSAVPGILYSRDKMIEQNKAQVADFDKVRHPDFTKAQREKLAKAEQELMKQLEGDKKTLANRLLKLEEYSKILHRMGLTLGEIDKIETVIKDADTEIQKKDTKINSLKKELSDLEAKHNESLTKIDNEVTELQRKIQEDGVQIKREEERSRKKDKEIQEVNQKILSFESDINNQNHLKPQLDQEIQILEGELNIKENAFKTLEHDIEKATKDISNLEYERGSLTEAQTSLFVEKENMGKNSARKTVPLGIAALLSIAAFSRSFLLNKK